MEKLKLEHIAPYLPYGLRGTIDGLDYFSSIELLGIRKEYIIWHCGWNYQHSVIEKYKPILRPLSDLTKMFNGDACYISYMWYGIISTDSDCFDKDEFFERCELGMAVHLPYIVIPFLLENHFDIFGLIDKGLAIDINTL